MRNPESSGGGEHRGEDRPESSIEREGKPGLRLFRHTALLSPSNAQKVLETSVAVLSRECVDAASAAQELLTTESTLEIVMANAALLDRSTLHHLIVPLLESPDTFSKVIAAARRLPESTITADMVIDAWDKGISLATFSEDALDGLLAIMPAEQIWDQAIKNGGFDSILAFLDKFPKGSISKERYAVLAKVAGDLSYDEELLAHFENFPPGILRAESLLKRVRNESVVADQVANLLAELPSKEPILDWVRKHSAQSSFLIRFDRLPAGVFDIADFVDMNTYHGEAEFLDGIPKLPVGGVDTAQVVRDLLEAGMTSVVIRNLPKLQEGTFDKKALLARADEEHLLADVIPFLGVFSFEEIAPYEEKILKALLLPSSFVHLSVFESLLRNDSPSPSYEKLVDKCVNQYISPDDFERLFPFFKRYRTPVELFERLLSANNRPTARRVAELLIREGAIDASRFFALCRLHENFELGMEHIPDFLADEKAVKSFAFEAAFIPSYSLAKFIDVFPAGTVLPGPLAAELSKQELPALQRNIERFPDSALTPDIVKQLQIDPVESVVEERYDLVRLWLKVQRPDERPHDFFAQSNAVRTVERLLGDGRIASAHRLAECLALTGAEIPSALRERLEAAVMPDEALPRERDEKTHVVHEEAAAFYVDSVISELLGRIMQAPDWRGRLDVRGRLAVEETKKAIARRTGEMKAWMREYLFAAVGGELENFYSSPLSWVGTDHEQLYRRAPKGRILDKIAAAAGTFLHPWWDKGYGGPKWAKIAEAAYALWASHAGEEALIDHVFDLEHNSGTVFDKNPGRVKGDDTVLKQVLDAKFAAETPADLLSAMAELTSPDLASELRQRYAVVRRAADALGIA